LLTFFISPCFVNYWLHVSGLSLAERVYTAQDELLLAETPRDNTLVALNLGKTSKYPDQFARVEYQRGGNEYVCIGDATNDPDFQTGRYTKAHMEACKRLLDFVRNTCHEWLRHSTFLWHRRKSQIAEPLAPGDFRALDSEAERLAGRLNAVLSGRNSLRHNAQINDFVNAVVPGMGEVHVARDTKHVKDSPLGSPETTYLSVKFANAAGEVYGLDALGGGVEQVLAIALVLLTEPDQGALFIEEPEAHLHESAQRRLVEQIEKHRGQRQIFIATHSPVFMNSFEDARIYRVTRDPDGKGRVAACVDLHDQRDTLDELGILPSTLLQTNCVVWVEGPTEVYLLKYWLHLVAPDLKVHLHYEFAETGGSNLAGFGVDLDPDGDDAAKLIDVFKICRHNFIVADRDAPPGQDPPKETLATLTKLIDGNNCADKWITWGHEIEWYYPAPAIQERWKVDLEISGQRPFYEALAASGAIGVKSAGKRKPKNAADLVNWSRESPDPAALWFTGAAGEDLKKNIGRLATFIRKANQNNPSPPQPCPTCGQTRGHTSTTVHTPDNG
jgi:hypothetical protein